jgi:hypothetical protein
VLKLKTKQFTSLTRSLTRRIPISSCEDLIAVALALRERVGLPPKQLYRLVGVGLSNFQLDEDAAETSVHKSCFSQPRICCCEVQFAQKSYVVIIRTASSAFYFAIVPLASMNL